MSTKRSYILKTNALLKATSFLKHTRYPCRHQFLKDQKPIYFEIPRNMKHKIILHKKNRKEKENVYLPLAHNTFYLPCFLLLYNAIIRVKDIKAVGLKVKFCYITPRREFFTTIFIKLVNEKPC